MGQHKNDFWVSRMKHDWRNQHAYILESVHGFGPRDEATEKYYIALADFMTPLIFLGRYFFFLKKHLRRLGGFFMRYISLAFCKATSHDLLVDVLPSPGSGVLTWPKRWVEPKQASGLQTKNIVCKVLRRCANHKPSGSFRKKRQPRKTLEKSAEKPYEQQESILSKDPMDCCFSRSVAGGASLRLASRCLWAAECGPKWGAFGGLGWAASVALVGTYNFFDPSFWGQTKQNKVFYYQNRGRVSRFLLFTLKLGLTKEPFFFLGFEEANPR